MFSDTISVVSYSINKKLAILIPQITSFLWTTTAVPTQLIFNNSLKSEPPSLRAAPFWLKPALCAAASENTRSLCVPKEQHRKNCATVARKAPLKGKSGEMLGRGSNRGPLCCHANGSLQQPPDNAQGEGRESQSIWGELGNSAFPAFFLSHKTLHVDSCEF